MPPKPKQKNITGFFIPKSVHKTAGTSADNTETSNSSDKVSQPHEKVQATAGPSSIDKECSEPVSKCRKHDTTRQSKTRTIRGNWFTKYKWLRHDREKKSFFCNWCIEGGKNNVFTMGKPDLVPKVDDFNKHADSGDHRFMVEARAASERGDMPKVTGKIYESIKDAVQATMKNIYFIAKQDLAKEKMQDLQEHVMLQGCKPLELLTKHEKVKYHSHDSVDEMINTISGLIEKDLLDKYNSAKFYALEMDESTDIGVCQNMMIYIRAVINGRVESHFLTIEKLEHGATAEALFNNVCGILEKKGLPKHNLIAVGTDGASVMTGKKSGVVTRLKNENPFMLSRHCAAHRLALASSQAASSIPYLVKYQALLNDIYKYYKYSPKNTNVLIDAQKMLDMENGKHKFQQVFGTRWLSFTNSVDAIINNFDALISALVQDVKVNKSNARAQGLLKQITKYKFIAVTYFMADVLAPLNMLCLTLQKKNLLFNDVQQALDLCTSSLTDLKVINGPNLRSFLGTLPDDIESRSEFIFKAHTVPVSPKQIAEFQSCKSQMLDNILQNLTDRFCEDDNLFTCCDVLVPDNMPNSIDDIKEYGKVFVDKFSEFFGEEKTAENGTNHPALINSNKFTQEWNTLKYLMFKCKNQTFEDFWAMIFNKFEDVYPNVCIVVSIVLTCPQTSVNVERGFSRQNIVKTKFRSSLTVENMDRLLMIKIEGPDMIKFNFDKAFESWCVQKDRLIFAPKVIKKINE